MFDARLIRWRDALVGPALGLVMLFGGVSAGAATVQVQVNDAAGKPLAEAVVFLESREAQAAVKPVLGTEIAQVTKQFTPKVVVVPVGSAVSFPNRDTVRHHVYSFSPAKTFELKLYVGTPTTPVVFTKSGIAVLGCNIHDNMAAWIVIVETPYYGRSAEPGRVTLLNVPPGNYRLRIWHPALPVGGPPSDQALVVGGDATVSVRLAGVSA